MHTKAFTLDLEHVKKLAKTNRKLIKTIQILSSSKDFMILELVLRSTSFGFLVCDIGHLVVLSIVWELFWFPYFLVLVQYLTELSLRYFYICA